MPSDWLFVDVDARRYVPDGDADAYAATCNGKIKIKMNMAEHNRNRNMVCTSIARGGKGYCGAVLTRGMNMTDGGGSVESNAG